MEDIFIPLQFASLYDGKGVFLWFICPLDLGTDYMRALLKSVDHYYPLPVYCCGNSFNFTVQIQQGRVVNSKRAQLSSACCNGEDKRHREKGRSCGGKAVRMSVQETSIWEECVEGRLYVCQYR